MGFEAILNMARAYVHEQAETSGPVTEYEARHVIRSLSSEKERRYADLVAKRDRGRLSPAERAELGALVVESEQLMLGNARALLRHRDPNAYADAIREEQRNLRDGPGRVRSRAADQTS